VALYLNEHRDYGDVITTKHARHTETQLLATRSETPTQRPCKLDALPLVSIDRRCSSGEAEGRKFILAEITADLKRKEVLRIGKNAYIGQEHKDIAFILSSEVGEIFGDSPVAVTVEGGGKLFIRSDTKDIFLLCESIRFGPADPKKVLKILKLGFQKEFKGFKIRGYAGDVPIRGQI
jgi:hypothetical protein